MGILDKIFGETTDDDHGRIFLPIIFCVILSSTTLFFYNYKTLFFFGYPLHLSMGLIFFPLTFTFTNVMQEKYGKLFANTAVRYGFLSDAILIFLSYILSYFGEREDYYSVYKEPPMIMGMTFVFVWMSTIINTTVFEKLKLLNKSAFTRFFLSSTLAETSISTISIPMMMFNNGLKEGAFLSIFFIVFYKIFFTLILSTIIAVRMMSNTPHR